MGLYRELIIHVQDMDRRVEGNDRRDRCNMRQDPGTGSEKNYKQSNPMWKKEKTLQEMQAACVDTLVQNLGMEFTRIGPDFIEARMPVDCRTRQPMGLLHGGASAAFAETLGGAGAYLSVEEGTVCVGLEINANHVRSVKQGWVIGRATAVHLGKTTQVWDIKMRDEQENLVCIARLTVAVR